MKAIYLSISFYPEHLLAHRLLGTITFKHNHADTVFLLINSISSPVDKEALLITEISYSHATLLLYGYNGNQHTMTSMHNTIRNKILSTFLNLIFKLNGE